MRLKLAKEIQQKAYKDVKFLKDKPIHFIAWISPMLIPLEF